MFINLLTNLESNLTTKSYSSETRRVTIVRIRPDESGTIKEQKSLSSALISALLLLSEQCSDSEVSHFKFKQFSIQNRVHWTRLNKLIKLRSEIKFKKKT